MKKRRLSFKKIYRLYLILLVLAMAAALIYVNVLLHQYEAMRPEERVEEAMDLLAEAAQNGTLWETYAMGDVTPGKWENGRDVKGDFIALLDREALSSHAATGMSAEDELEYVIENNGVELATVRLKAKGPYETKLAVLNYREWETVSVQPMLEAKDYTLRVPTDFTVHVNDAELTEADGIVSDNEITYTLEGVYLLPKLAITDQNGENVPYTVKNNRIQASFYDYTLVLPAALTVTCNGQTLEGSEKGDSVAYRIRALEQPKVMISDYYGNEVEYNGQGNVPLTYMTVLADSRYQVSVQGQQPDERAVTVTEKKEYVPLKDYVQDLPQVIRYEIAVLSEAAEVKVTDEKGVSTALEAGKTTYDFSAPQMFAEVPQDIAAQVDVLEIAKQWSLFMSNDLPFENLEKYLVKDSYQYKVARQYARGIDIRFTSDHTLDSVPFTDEKVTNYTPITEECFSVDISFVKHMILKAGGRVDDNMNDRFYFVKSPEANDKGQSTWKLLSMKEIVDNEK